MKWEAYLWLRREKLPLTQPVSQVLSWLWRTSELFCIISKCLFTQEFFAPNTLSFGILQFPPKALVTRPEKPIHAVI